MKPAFSIVDLPRRLAALTDDARVKCERIFDITPACGQTDPPPAMHGWLGAHFGSASAVVQQRIVKITNKITLEGALFNDLRARRPIEAPRGGRNLEDTIAASAGGPFCRPDVGTPADTFGRIRGRHAITASNVAKYDGWHAVIVFDEHHPLHFSAEQVADYVETALTWARAVQALDHTACYPFFLWNCLWRSGASILHGHAQITMTRGMAYARVEGWRQAATRYRVAYGADYFDDLVAVQRALDLAVDHGEAVILPSLTPFKEKETVILGPRSGADLTSAIYRVLAAFRDRLGVQSFNLALYLPPLAPTPESWEGFPAIVRALDRGSLENNTADIGAMEIFGQSVVAADPYAVAEALRP